MRHRESFCVLYFIAYEITIFSPVYFKVIEPQSELVYKLFINFSSKFEPHYTLIKLCLLGQVTKKIGYVKQKNVCFRLHAS